MQNSIPAWDLDFFTIIKLSEGIGQYIWGYFQQSLNLIVGVWNGAPSLFLPAAWSMSLLEAQKDHWDQLATNEGRHGQVCGNPLPTTYSCLLLPQSLCITYCNRDYWYWLYMLQCMHMLEQRVITYVQLALRVNDTSSSMTVHLLQPTYNWHYVYNDISSSITVHLLQLVFSAACAS